MKPLLTAITGLCILTAFPALAQEVRLQGKSAEKSPGRVYPHWTVFAHPRFGFELPVPPGVRAMGRPDSGADSTFVSLDGAFKITAWGGMSPFPAATLLASEWNNAQQRAGGTGSYGRKNAAGFVLSGVKQGHTRFYEKMIIQGDRVAAFTLTLPNSRTREFARWVEEIDDGFALVDGPNGEPPEVAQRAQTNSTAVLHDAMLRRPDPLFPEESRQADLIPESSFPLEARPPLTGEKSPTTVDVTPPDPAPASDTGESQPDKDANAGPSKTGPPTSKETKPPATELPVGEPVPGKTGFVYSPFLTEKKLVDAVDIPARTKVKCPYTGKIFRLP